MFKLFSCWRYRAQVGAYLDGELPPRVRRRVARHIDQCPVCYRHYIQERELRRELYHVVPLVGQQNLPDFARMWGAIRAEIPQPETPPYPFRYGLAALLFALIVLLPFTMGHRELARALPPQPVPHVTETPESTEPVAIATVAASLTTESKFQPATSPPTVPEPDTQNES